MTPRTIVLSLLAHGLAAVLLVTLDGDPPARSPTTIQIVQAPASRAPASAPPSAPPTAPPTAAPVTAAPATAAPKRTRPARRRAAPKTPRTARRAPAAAAKTPFYSGLVLGNADGPGIAVGVPEDVERRTEASGGGVVAAAPPVAAPIAPITAAEPPKPRRARCTDIVRPRVAERRARIEYVESARAAGVEGRLVLRLHLSASGVVRRVEVVTTVHPDLDRAAVAAARQWRFTPERRCGAAVASTFVVARRFELTD